MKQTYTSAATSINSSKLPAVYGRAVIPAGSIVFDYGCGRYTDHIRAALPGVVYLPYDPYNQPQHVNAASVRAVDAAKRKGRPVIVVCSNVLNVVDSDAEVQAIVDNIAAIVRHTGGRAYIYVWEGNRSGVGKQTGPDQYQRNERHLSYLRFVPDSVRAYVTRHMIVLEVKS